MSYQRLHRPKAWKHLRRQVIARNGCAFSRLLWAISLGRQLLFEHSLQHVGVANRRGLIKFDNPCLGVQRYPENKRKRYLTAPEIKLLADAFTEEEQNNPFAVAAIKMLIMTGARLGEILSAKWEWIDGDILKLPDSKTGAKDITLPSPEHPCHFHALRIILISSLKKEWPAHG